MKSLFLKWALIESVAITLFVALGLVGYATNLHGLPLIIVTLLGIIGLSVTGYAGKLCWKYENKSDSKNTIIHHSENIFHSMWLCMVLGMVGALMVYRQEANTASNSDNVSTAIHSVFASLANGLTATLMGLLCSLVIFLQHRLLDHELNKP